MAFLLQYGPRKLKAECMQQARPSLVWGLTQRCLRISIFCLTVDRRAVRKCVPLTALVAVAALAGCVSPDGKALQTLACQQVANSIDLHSVGQLDLLRKAMGLAPSVDPIGACRALGVNMTPEPESQSKNGANTGANSSPQE